MNPQTDPNAIDVVGLVQPRRAEIARHSDDGLSATFEMYPLERGYGHTLGNAMRRALLSSLRGASVWAFRVPGVVHQHDTIEGVIEDVHQVIQNLKYLVVRLDDDVDSAVLEIRASRRGPVTASMIRGPAAVEIHDPTHHILTLEDDNEIHVELHVNKGRGFVRAEEHDVPDNAPVDLVPIDSIYNPVLRANFTVEDTRWRQRTDYDKLTLEVRTDGSIRPAAALHNAAELVRKHVGFILDGPPPRTAEPVPMPPHMARILETTLNDLAELPTGTRNSLLAAGVNSVEDLVTRTRDEVSDLKNLGDKAMAEIDRLFGDHGLSFAMKLHRREDGRLFLLEDPPPARRAASLAEEASAQPAGDE